MFRAKFRAFCLHLVITLVVTVLVSYLIYWLWFPGRYAEMVGGIDLYWILLGVEMSLGPVMSLVIFNPTKSSKELVKDYSVVGCVQLAALLYGVYVISVSRPVYVVFVKDRLELVVAAEFKGKDLKEAELRYSTLSWSGPRLVCTEGPTDPKEKSDLLMSALEGKDIQLMPRYFRECRPGEILERAYSEEQLEEYTPISLQQLPVELQEVSFRWLPVVTRFGVWTAFYTEDVGVDKPTYVDLDPFW